MIVQPTYDRDGSILYYDEERPTIQAACSECGGAVNARYSGRTDWNSGEPIYICECPECGRRRART